MVRDDKDTYYYRNMRLFVKEIKDAMASKGASMVRTNLNTCLRGYVSIFYTAQLNSLNARFSAPWGWTLRVRSVGLRG